jgi:hypothetical protein
MVLNLVHTTLERKLCYCRFYMVDFQALGSIHHHIYSPQESKRLLFDRHQLSVGLLSKLTAIYHSHSLDMTHPKFNIS